MGRASDREATVTEDFLNVWSKFLSIVRFLWALGPPAADWAGTVFSALTSHFISL